MVCEWEAFLMLLPMWMRWEVDKLGSDKLLELRLRLGQPPELIFQTGSKTISGNVSENDLQQCINYASRYSPWASTTLAQGYITARGGHRIGVCGTYVTAGGNAVIKNPGMLCIRVARDIQGISGPLAAKEGSLLILGKPGSGKTTLMRDLIRKKSAVIYGSISVVDEREEIFPKWQGRFCFSPGRRTDVISGCKKEIGINLVLKNMTPQIIALDEITQKEDCDALIQAGWCGVTLYATAHAGSVKDLFSRKIYQPIIESGLFDHYVVMNADKSWREERVSM